MAAPIVDCTGTGFGLDNLPWGCFVHRTSACGTEAPSPRASVGVRIGDHVLDVTQLQQCGYVRDLPGAAPRSELETCFQHGRLNEFLALGRPAWRAARSALQQLLDGRQAELRDNTALLERVLLPLPAVRMVLPAAIGDYTDFYASREHATNVGTMFRGPDAALSPNWLHLPVGYHGRASSIVPSGCEVHRPRGQVLPAGASSPVFGPSASIDFELEVAAVIGPGNAQGEAIPVDAGWEHVFGLTLMNDWSARDIQKWEYVPLGPFNGKNWATQVSPWVTPMEALEPYRCAAPPQDQPPVLGYLREAQRHTYDVTLAVDLMARGAQGAGRGAAAAAAAPGEQGGGADDGGDDDGLSAATVSVSNLKHLYWTFPQMIAHHTAGGCNLRPGDLLGSGTISGPLPGSRGCLLELSWGGTQQVECRAGARTLPRAAVAAKQGASGSSGAWQRKYLQDGDSVVLRGWCGGDEPGGAWLQWGECRGTLQPSR